MSLVERIDQLEALQKALNQSRPQEIEAERVRQEAEEDNRRQRHLALFGEFLKETGLRSMFDEIVEGKKLNSAEINTLVSQDGTVVSLEMSWPAKGRTQYPGQLGALVPPAPGFNRISLGVDYRTDTFFVRGALLKFSGVYTAGLNPEDIEDAVAGAYVDPKWQSSVRLELASEVVK